MIDDDMIVVLVGDEDNPEGSDIKDAESESIKQEPLSPSEDATEVDQILKTVAKHGEYIKQEPEDYIEYLEDEYLKHGEYNIKQEPEDYIEYLEDEYFTDIPKEATLNNSINSVVENTSYNEDCNEEPAKRRVRAKNSKQNSQLKNMQKENRVYKTSYVAQLRKQHPEFRTNTKLLVEHLAGIMRSMEPPTLPLNYCTSIVDGSVIKYECNTCGNKSGTVPLAARHFQEKHGPRYLICYACGADFRGTTNLYKHEKRCSAKDAKIVLRARGRFLGRKGKGRPFVTQHKFQPKILPPVFKAKGRFYCALCPASFRHKQNLEAHENSHAGRRPYVCHACPAAYTSEPALKRHMTKHGDDRFICDHCGRGFKLKPLLKSHLNTHLPIRRFGCDRCERRFAHKNALRHHINHFHLQLPAEYGCLICPKRYARMSHVKEHMKREHDLTMITRKMFYKVLPTMTELEIKEARVIHNHELARLGAPPAPLPPITLDQMEAEPRKRQKTKRKSDNPKKIDDHDTYHIIQDDGGVWSDSRPVVECVVVKDENQDSMTNFLRYIQSKVEPGKVIKIQNSAFTKLCEAKVETISNVESDMAVLFGDDM